IACLANFPNERRRSSHLFFEMSSERFVPLVPEAAVPGWLCLLRLYQLVTRHRVGHRSPQILRRFGQYQVLLDQDLSWIQRTIKTARHRRLTPQGLTFHPPGLSMFPSGASRDVVILRSMIGQQELTPSQGLVHTGMNHPVRHSRDTPEWP